MNIYADKKIHYERILKDPEGAKKTKKLLKQRGYYNIKSQRFNFFGEDRYLITAIKDYPDLIKIFDYGCPAHEPHEYLAHAPITLYGGFNGQYDPMIIMGKLARLGDTGSYICSFLSTHQVEVIDEIIDQEK